MAVQLKHYHGKMTSDEKRRFWKIGLIVAVILGILFLVFVAYPLYQRHEIRKRQVIIKSLYEKADAEAAADECADIIKEYPGTAAADEAEKLLTEMQPMIHEAYEAKCLADAAYKDERYEEALVQYRAIAENYPNSRRGEEAKQTIPGCERLACKQLIALAEIEAGKELWNTAHEYYAKAAAIRPEFPGVQEGLRETRAILDDFAVLMRNAKAFENEAAWRQALRVYNDALKLMPHSEVVYKKRIYVARRIPPPPGMKLIPPGRYSVGAGSSKRTLKTGGFYLDEHEVTNREYAAFIEATHRPAPSHWPAREPPPETMDLPVVCVTWDDATAYAAWAGKRLPTQIEWECAARGQVKRTYPWGHKFTREGVVLSHGPAPVGTAARDRSPDGCADMAGNVAEWTANSDRDNFNLKVICGNSWAGIERERFNWMICGQVPEDQRSPADTIIAPGSSTTNEMNILGMNSEFLLRNRVEDAFTFEIRQWLPERRVFVTARFPIRLGEEIAGACDVPIPDGNEREKQFVEFKTGCRLLEVLHPDSTEEMTAIVSDPAGIKRSMPRSTRKLTSSSERLAQESAPRKSILAERVQDNLAKRRKGSMPRPLPGSKLAGKRLSPRISRQTRILPEPTEENFAVIMRSMNRMFAPRKAAFINCGFRCARDL